MTQAKAVMRSKDESAETAAKPRNGTASDGQRYRQCVHVASADGIALRKRKH
jgi:hypothetical protein